MAEKQKKSLVFKYVVISVLAYVVWLVGGRFIVDSIDSVYEIVNGVRFIDAWTPGLMVWNIMLYVFPLVFLVFLPVAIIYGKKKSGQA